VIPPGNPGLGLANFNNSDFSQAACEGQGSVELTPPTYVDELRLCGAAAIDGVCEDGGSCMPPSQGPLCIYGTGQLECPAGWPVEHAIVVGVDDQRSCTECTCEGPTSPSCKSNITTYDDDACGMVKNMRETGQSCGPMSGASLMVESPEITGCTANAVQPTGEALPLDDVLVCCQG
ncbi:MAG: hypothetical protein KC457_23625, partial [Myxococcales bacterium]|nr:hypothetical protein [Myxococcales bacterium]